MKKQLMLALLLTTASATLAATVDTFDVAGTPRTDVQVGSEPGPEVIGGGWDTGGQNVMRIVDAVGSQSNQIAYDLSDPGVFTTISGNFEYRATELGSRADGIGVVLLSTADYGTSGGIAGFTAEEPELAGSIGVGFDIYNNGATDNDSNNHVSVHYPGFTTRIEDVTGLGINLADGIDHLVQINVDVVAEGTDVSVWIDNIDVFGGAVSIPDVTAYESRLLMAGRTGGASALIELDNVEFAYGSIPPVISLTIDRDTGDLSLVNDSEVAYDILGYSITSGAGALDQSGWTPISGNYDAPSNGGDGSVDADDPWTVLTAVGSHTDLSESELARGDGGVVGVGDRIDFGSAWIQSPSEDLRMELLLASGERSRVWVEYVGNDDAPFALGDLNFNGGIDPDDWTLFRAGMGDAYPSLTITQAYQMGDLDGDLDNDLADFRIFEVVYDAAIGPGALAALMAVPEPSTLVLLTLGGLWLLATGRRRSPGGHAAFVVVMAMALATASAALAETVDTFDVAGTPRTDVQWGSAPGPEVIGGGWDTGGPNVMRLVDAVGSQNNQIAYDLSDPGVFTTISANFEYRATQGVDIGGTGRADGIGVVLLNTADHGLSGGIGSFTAEEPELAGSIGVGIDIYNSGASDNDNNNHVSVHYPGFTTRIEDVTGLGIDLADGVNHTVQIDVATPSIVSGAGDVTVWIDGTDVFGGAVSIPGVTAYESRLLMAGRTGGENALIELDNIDVEWRDRTGLSLLVNTVTGSTSLVNLAGEAISINGYQLTSAAGSLDTVGWDSFEDQDLPDFPAGDGSGNGWEEGGSINPTSLIEADLQGDSTLAIGDSLPIGNPFDTGGAAQDLVFHYSVAGGALLAGYVEYVSDPGEFPLGDVNQDMEVNGLDVDPFVDVLLNGPYQREADMNEDSVVNGLDVDPFVEAVVGGGLQAVPEPSTLALLALAGLAMVLRISKGGRLMNRFSLLSLLAAGLLVTLIGTTARADSTNDRAYLFGDSTGVPAQNENATAGQKIGSGAGGVTFDSVSESNNPGNDNDAQNLSPSATAGPTYVSVGQGPFQRSAADGDPTPPAAGDLGAQFNGSDEYLRGARLGLPSTAAGTIGYGDVAGGAVWNPNDYTGISNRGYQLWVYPTSNAAAQSVVMDTNQHGVRISAAGNWSMHYPGGTDVESTMPVATDQWSHVMLVRPFGAAGGGRLYVDGIVVAANGVGYTGDDNASLVLGSNTDQDADGNFTGGTEEFFSGLMDNLEMFVLGTSTGDNPEDFGTFDPQTDNQFIAGAMAGVPDGDVDMDGTLDPVADVDAFVAGWLNLNEVNGMQVGDLGSRAAGDLNFDGITDLSDAFVLHEALAAAGGGLDFSALTAAVPEPSTLVLLSLAAVLGLAWRPRSAQVS